MDVCLLDGIKWKQLTPLPAFFLPASPSFHQTRQLRVSMLPREPAYLPESLSQPRAQPLVTSRLAAMRRQSEPQWEPCS